MYLYNAMYSHNKIKYNINIRYVLNTYIVTTVCCLQAYILYNKVNNIVNDNIIIRIEINSFIKCLYNNIKCFSITFVIIILI